MSDRIVSIFALAALYPQLPAAGCRAHHATPVTADVSGAAARVAVLYAPAGTAVAETDRWSRLRDCENRVEGNLAAGVVRISGCTSYIGVDYAIDIIAVDDANDNGALDPGERFGAWADGPLVRDREESVGVISIMVDQTFAGAVDRP